MSSTLILRPGLGSELEVYTTTTGGFVIAVDNRYASSYYESIAISAQDAEQLIQFLQDALIQNNFEKASAENKAKSKHKLGIV